MGSHIDGIDAGKQQSTKITGVVIGDAIAHQWMAFFDGGGKSKEKGSEIDGSWSLNGFVRRDT